MPVYVRFVTQTPGEPARVLDLGPFRAAYFSADTELVLAMEGDERSRVVARRYADGFEPCGLPGLRYAAALVHPGAELVHTEADRPTRG